jgi:PAS domain S-box-containing protein
MVIDLLKILVKASRDAVFVADVQSGHILYANEAACRLTGYTCTEILGKHQSQLHPADELEFIGREFQRFVSSDELHAVNAHILHKNGSSIPVAITSADRFEDNGVLYAAAYFKDLTPQVKLGEIAFLQSHIVRAPVATALGLLGLIESETDKNSELSLEALRNMRIIITELDNVIKSIVAMTDVSDKKLVTEG